LGGHRGSEARDMAKFNILWEREKQFTKTRDKTFILKKNVRQLGRRTQKGTVCFQRRRWRWGFRGDTRDGKRNRRGYGWGRWGEGDSHAEGIILRCEGEEKPHGKTCE